MLLTISGMKSGQRDYKFRQSQVYTWESEPKDERPSEFQGSAFRSTYGPPSEFANSNFMDPAPARSGRRRHRESRHLRRIAVLATVGIVLVSGTIVLVQSAFA